MEVCVSIRKHVSGKERHSYHENSQATKNGLKFVSLRSQDEVGIAYLMANDEDILLSLKLHDYRLKTNDNISIRLAACIGSLAAAWQVMRQRAYRGIDS